MEEKIRLVDDEGDIKHLIGEMIEQTKRDVEKLYTDYFEDSNQKKFRKKPTNITPKKKKRK